MAAGRAVCSCCLFLLLHCYDAGVQVCPGRVLATLSTGFAPLLWVIVLTCCCPGTDAVLPYCRIIYSRAAVALCRITLIQLLQVITPALVVTICWSAGAVDFVPQ